MFDLIVIWVFYIWLLMFVLGFHFALEESPQVVRMMINASDFNPLIDELLNKVGSRLLWVLRCKLSAVKVHNPQIARLICKTIPACCPFERDIQILGHTCFHVPALCKLNPFYDQLMELRFRALSYLADECKEDVTIYC